MKRTGIKLLFSAAVIVLLCCAASQFASAQELSVTLDISDGDEISAAFNRAADLARFFDDDSHLTVTVPAGTYTSNAGLRVYSHTTVLMEGATIRHTDSSTTMLRLGRRKADWEDANDGEGHPGYSGFSDITFEGGTFDGGFLQQAIMRFGHSTNITLRNVTFRNILNAHMIEIGGCKDVLFERCTFANFRGNWEASTNYEALQLEIVSTQGNHFNGYNPDNDETPCENITVTGCTFRNLQRGIGTHSAITGSFFSNINITDNTFYNITGFAVITTNYRDSRINGNRISKCGAGIYMRTMELSHTNVYRTAGAFERQTDYPLLNCEIKNNRMSITQGYKAIFGEFTYGIQLTGELLKKRTGNTPGGDYRIADVLVSGNVIRLNGVGHGIWINGAAENRITGNDITLTVKTGTVSSAGIRMQKSVSNRLLRNKITIKNKSSFREICGISFLGGCTDNLIYKNSINAASKDGIYLEFSDRNGIRGNTIEAPGRDGIHLEQSDSLTVLSNTVKAPGRSGIVGNGVTNTKYIKNKTVW